MIELILSTLGLSDSSFNSAGDTRRKHQRHPGHQTEIDVAGRVYSVRDWSLGGIFFDTPPDSRMVLGDKVNFDLRFRLPHETITIQHTAKVVRSATRGIAAEFMPLAPDVRRKFDRVIDWFHTQSFLESQVA